MSFILLSSQMVDEKSGDKINVASPLKNHDEEDKYIFAHLLLSVILAPLFLCE